MGRTKRRVKIQHQGARKDPRDGFPPIVKKNVEFEAFYKRQKIVAEDEWEAFMVCLTQPLPITFRVTGAISRGEAGEFMNIIKRDYFPLMDNMEVDGEKILPPSCLPWYPRKNCAWKLNLGRTTLRKQKKLSELHACISVATESGHISRQEAVSMIPPLLMDIKSHHKILDMCAAPGSKTAQMVEMLHEGCDGVIPEGYVIANDIDNNRCYTMIHQVKRLQSPCVIMINENATCMPAFLETKKGDKDYVFFDRILADVPCSGDGTMRKNLDIWKRWNIGNGRGLHTLQKRILFRGLRMLAVGGRLVYSTCSFNPLENEAVVASALRNFKGCVRLVDVSDQLPGLKTNPGLCKWSVFVDHEKNERTFQELTPNILIKYRETMWPPSVEEAEEFHLERCLRLLPHHNDTGGFFVAVLEKVKDTRPSKDDDVETKENESQNEADGIVGSEGDINAPKSDPENPSDKAKMTKREHGDDSSDEPNPKLRRHTHSTSNSADKHAAENVKRVMDGDGDGDANDKKDIKIQEESTTKATPVEEEAEDKEPDEPETKRKFHGFKEDPFIYFKHDESIWPNVRDFYALTDNFPHEQFLGRCEGPKKKNLYFTSASVRKFMDANADRLKVINLGVKAMTRIENQYCECSYRLTQDAIFVLRQFVKERVVKLEYKDVSIVLSAENPFVERLSKSAQEQLAPLKQGGLIFIYEPNGRDGPQCGLTLCGWKGLTSVRSFTPKLERQFYLLLCGHKEFTTVKRPRDDRQQRMDLDAPKKDPMPSSHAADEAASHTADETPSHTADETPSHTADETPSHTADQLTSHNH